MRDEQSAGSDPDTRKRILAFVAVHTTLTLATASEGVPWAAALFYVNDGFDFYFLSDQRSRHTQYLAANPHVSATINEDCQTWSEIKGIQIEGVCMEVVGPADLAHAFKLYTAKYPFIADLLQAPLALGAAMAKAKFYRMKPRWVRLVDNSRGFGWKETLRPE